jgi:hypothetical protein
MSDKYKLEARVVNGRVVFDYPGLAAKCISEFEGKKVSVTYQQIENAKSLSHLNFYIGILIKKYIMKDIAFAGNDMDDVIEYFLDRTFGYEKEYRINKVKLVKRSYPSLSGLSSSKLVELTERTIQIATTEFGMDLSDIDKIS